MCLRLCSILHLFRDTLEAGHCSVALSVGRVERGKGRFEWASAAICEPTPLGGYFAQHFAEVVGRRPQRIRQKIAFIYPALAFLRLHAESIDRKRFSVENDAVTLHSY